MHPCLSLLVFAVRLNRNVHGEDHGWGGLLRVVAKGLTFSGQSIPCKRIRSAFRCGGLQSCLRQGLRLPPGEEEDFGSADEKK